MKQRYKFFALKQYDEITVAELSTLVGAAFAEDELAVELNQFCDRSLGRFVVVDFRNIESCNSATIAALVAVQRRFQERDGSVKLSGMSPRIRDVFQRLKLEGTIFTIHETEEDAVSAFRRERCSSDGSALSDTIDQPPGGGSLLRVVTPLRLARHGHEGHGGDL